MQGAARCKRPAPIGPKYGTLPPPYDPTRPLPLPRGSMADFTLQTLPPLLPPLRQTRPLPPLPLPPTVPPREESPV